MKLHVPGKCLFVIVVIVLLLGAISCSDGDGALVYDREYVMPGSKRFQIGDGAVPTPEVKRGLTKEEFIEKHLSTPILTSTPVAGVTRLNPIAVPRTPTPTPVYGTAALEERIAALDREVSYLYMNVVFYESPNPYTFED